MDKFIANVVEQITKLVDVHKIILFSKKEDLTGEISSFKICVIISCGMKNVCEKNIYINVDSEIPFDVVVYTYEEWENLRKTKGSFGNKIDNIGRVIYE